MELLATLRSSGKRLKRARCIKSFSEHDGQVMSSDLSAGFEVRSQLLFSLLDPDIGACASLQVRVTLVSFFLNLHCLLRLVSGVAAEPHRFRRKRLRDDCDHGDPRCRHFPATSCKLLGDAAHDAFARRARKQDIVNVCAMHPLWGGKIIDGYFEGKEV
eukprot:5337287-Pleurochrysis_carterae.AAC.2